MTTVEWPEHAAGELEAIARQDMKAGQLGILYREANEVGPVDLEAPEWLPVRAKANVRAGDEGGFWIVVGDPEARQLFQERPRRFRYEGVDLQYMEKLGE